MEKTEEVETDMDDDDEDEKKSEGSSTPSRKGLRDDVSVEESEPFPPGLRDQHGVPRGA